MGSHIPSKVLLLLRIWKAPRMGKFCQIGFRSLGLLTVPSLNKQPTIWDQSVNSQVVSLSDQCLTQSGLNSAQKRDLRARVELLNHLLGSLKEMRTKKSFEHLNLLDFDPLTHLFKILI